MMKRFSSWAWLWFIFGALYLVVPLIATFQFSLLAKRDEVGFAVYANVLQSPDFVNSFLFSFRTALLTIFIRAVLIVPTAYWVHLRLPFLRSTIEFFTLLPFVIPAIVLVFGLIRTYNGTSLTDSSQGVYVLMVGAYVMLSFPYMYRSIDIGLSTIKVQTLTEAAQSLGTSWFTILLRIIFPNVLGALLNGAFITFAIVMGEFTIASLLSQPAFGPYMYDLNSRKVYEPLTLAIISFLLTWASILVIDWLGRGKSRRLSPASLR